MKRMTRPVIIDSSALFSLVSRDDMNHQQALTLSATFRPMESPVLLPGEIFTETLNIIGKKIGKEKREEVGNDLLTSGAFIFVDTTVDIRQAAFAKLLTQPASVSFTDCLVMAVADFFKTKVIFGFDEVFAKNGYRLPEAPNQQEAA
jgi:predicted nucleic acid-binding protein